MTWLFAQDKMAFDHRTLIPDVDFDSRSISSGGELDFMYDKSTIDQASIFLEDGIMVSFGVCCLVWGHHKSDIFKTI